MSNLNIRIDLLIFSVVSVYIIFYMIVCIARMIEIKKGNS